MTLASVVERLAVELSLPVLKTWVCPDRESNPDSTIALFKSQIHDFLLLKTQINQSKRNTLTQASKNDRKP